MRRGFAGLLLVACLVAPAGAEPVEGWSGDRAMAHIRTQLGFGSRAIGTQGHESAVAWIAASGSAMGKRVQVVEQRWAHTRAPGDKVALTNLILRLNPAASPRMVVGTHYDSIIRAYRDPENPQGEMPGANNSASGVAVLLETLRVLVERKQTVQAGIDFVFFDGEEGPLALGAGDPDWHPLGSPHFVRKLGDLYGGRRPTQAVILDMVCAAGARIPPEAESLRAAPALVERFWSMGRQIDPAIFVKGPVAAVHDDQMAFIKAGIPSFLIIGFDYAPWFNTTQDSLDKCSAHTLSVIGRTLVRYLDAQ